MISNKSKTLNQQELISKSKMYPKDWDTCSKDKIKKFKCDEKSKSLRQKPPTTPELGKHKHKKFILIQSKNKQN